MTSENTRFPLAVAVLALLALAGCSAHSKPSAIETSLANAAKDVAIPLQAEQLTNPSPNTDLTLAQAQPIFETNCALCHSSDGHSQNQLGLAMYPPAADLTSPHVQAWKDPEMFWIIQNGIRLTGMPGWQGIISTQDSWKLVRYIHALPQMTPQRAAQLEALIAPPPPPKPAKPAATPPAPMSQTQLLAYGNRLIKQEGCLNCHTFDGDGENMAPDLSAEGTRGRTPDWLAGHFKDPAAYSKGSRMPAFTHLTPTQLQALIALLESAKG